MGKKMKEFTLYAAYPGGRFTSRVGDFYAYPKPGRSVYRVRAQNIRQAYALARQRQWAEGPNQLGLISRETNRDQGPNDVEQAPYLQK